MVYVVAPSGGAIWSRDRSRSLVTTTFASRWLFDGIVVGEGAVVGADGAWTCSVGGGVETSEGEVVGAG